MDDEDIEHINIVPISEQHIGGYFACLDSVARERSYLGLVEAPPVEDARKFARSIMAGGGVLFVAVRGDEVVGWCDIVQMKQEGFRHNGRLGMGVLRAYRRMGWGERLARKAIEWAEGTHIERITLKVFASNLAAISLYEKLGFEVEGVSRKARKIDGKYDDLVEMVLFT
jgi:RimJ/RimL family protein N-acetyltransferase